MGVFFIIHIEGQSLGRVVFRVFNLLFHEFSCTFSTNMACIQASCTQCPSHTVHRVQCSCTRSKTAPNSLLLLPASLLRYPDRSAALFLLPCQTALFGAGEWPVVLFLKSSWLGYAAPKSVSDSTWCPLQTPLSWPAGGRMGCWAAEEG